MGVINIKSTIKKGSLDYMVIFKGKKKNKKRGLKRRRIKEEIDDSH